MEHDEVSERIHRVAQLYRQFDNEYWAFVSQLHHAGRHLGITGPDHERQAMAEITYVGELFYIGLRLVIDGGNPLGEIYLDHVGDEAIQRVGRVFLDEGGQLLDAPAGAVLGQIRDPDIARHLLVSWLDGWLQDSADLKTL
ncbi:hypothetical protein [Thiohalophilus thiocyanatoxydans]|uniref:Uncharacterized protein n=1 Tax=Thiohalophilus thiocyanatoxydans TaxID=381308 RepID=A0A4R8IYD4_9GAMM|nr:hypothetical protein [Thiohalophilus thiocyanatoxydans]TDY02433.1 hypothetical protein EDC23_0803 [Thiohalophilus thiocyanatoxydans]